ncbi:acyltransferase [Knoellia locipacati]|uniref:acyltransferase family protein n=1 Tax=Knoellia locipacati TaxID=882824 RepID=UPI00384EDBB0
MGDTPRRDRSFDVARGIAILAIVVGHVVRGLAADDLVPRTSPLVLEVDDAFYSFHLTIFAVLLGVFLRPGVEKHGPGAYVRSRVALFAYLYAVWTVLFGATRRVTDVAAETAEQGVEQGVDAVDPEAVAGAVAGRWDGFVGDRLHALLLADGPLWWLGFLVLVTVAGAVVRPWTSRTRAVASSVVVVTGSLLVWGWTGPWVFLEGLALLAFAWGGILVGRERLTAVTRPSRASWIALVGLGAGAAALWFTDPMPPTSWLGPRTLNAVAWGVPTSVALCLGTFALSGILARRRTARPLAFLGERSLEIFLAHIVLTDIARHALTVADVTDITTHVVVGSIAGVLGPLALWWLGRRAHAPWLFQRPHLRRRRAGDEGGRHTVLEKSS